MEGALGWTQVPAGEGGPLATHKTTSRRLHGSSLVSSLQLFLEKTEAIASVEVSIFVPHFALLVYHELGNEDLLLRPTEVCNKVVN